MGFIKQEFIDWLRAEMSARGWNQSDLARAAHKSHTAIGSILNGLRPAGPELCNGIAEAFNLPYLTVYIKAGLIPPERVQTPLLNEINHKASLLSQEKQEIVIDLLDGLLAGKNKNGPPEP